MKKITYATKVWSGEWLSGLNRHPGADLIIGNNLGKRFIDIGDTGDFYFKPEFEAVMNCKTEYILWYSCDVDPPRTDWLTEALPLLEKYAIVTCRWDNVDIRLHEEDMVERTDFGWTTYLFSDQCYLAKTKTMQEMDYDVEHEIKDKYPEHGGNSFERRVGQWLAHNEKPMAVLDGHFYRHIDQREK